MATLSRVRDRCLRSEAAWTQLAERAATTIDVEGGRTADRKMTKIIRKSKPAMEQLRRLAELKPASLSARDPVAFAAALQVLG